MTELDIDWKRIRQLRQAFLEASGYLADYWQDPALLQAYDLTLGRRIAWKWQAVLEASRDSLAPLAAERWPMLVDWGCGTGVAARTLLASQLLSFESVLFTDRSAKAVRFAQEKLRQEFPGQTLSQASVESPENLPPFVLVISHVLSEMPSEAQTKLLQLARRAKLILWVEAGRTLESRGLSALREQLRSSHSFLAPCPHQETCGMLAPEQSQQWCHFHASVPQEAFRSAFWKRCSQELGFDLRSLPVSYLIAAQSGPQLPKQNTKLLRILGGSRSYKAFCRWTACGSSGIISGEYPKRASRELYRTLAEAKLETLVPAEAILGSLNTSREKG